MNYHYVVFRKHPEICTLTTEEDPKKRKVGRKITRKNIEIRKKRSKWEWELDFKHNYKDEC